MSTNKDKEVVWTRVETPVHAAIAAIAAACRYPAATVTEVILANRLGFHHPDRARIERAIVEWRRGHPHDSSGRSLQA